MKTLKHERNAVAGSFVFLLLGVFAIFAVLMVLLTAQLYRNSISDTQRNNARRIAGSYLMNIVTSGDRSGAVSVADVEGNPAIRIAWPGEDDEDEGYCTLIYVSDGQLRELVADLDEEPEAAYGETVCAMQSMMPTLSGNLLTVACTDANGNEETLSICLYTAEGGALRE